MKPSREKDQKRAAAKPTAKEIMHASQPRKVFTNMTKRRELMASTAVVKHPVSSEKAIRLMESENKLVFVVDIKADKASIKKAVEELYKAKVANVNTHIVNGEKRAYVRFAPESPAIDIATSLGLM